MNATSSAQKSTKTAGIDTPKAAPKAGANDAAFSDIMSQIKKKNSKISQAAAPLAPASAGKVKAASKGVDLSFLGEVEEKTPKGGGIKLTDILAEISHGTGLPKGTEVINFKNILGASNDDPALINKDLINLLPKEQRGKITVDLINGIKQEVKGRLAKIIPSERIPTTLKGMIETAIRFDIKVDNIKLETIKDNKASKELLGLFKANEKALASLPAQVKVDLNKKAQVDTKTSMKKGEASPLEKILEQKNTKVETDSKVKATENQKVVKADTKTSKVDTPHVEAKASQSETESVKKAAPIVVAKTVENEIATTKSAKPETGKPINIAKSDEVMPIKEAKSEIQSDEELLKTPKNELGGEAGRRLAKKDTVRERVDLEIGKDLATKKNEASDPTKHIAIATDAAVIKNSSAKRVDLPARKIEKEKIDKKTEKETQLKAVAKEENGKLLDDNVAKTDVTTQKLNGEKPATQTTQTTTERVANATEGNENVKSDSTTHVTKSEVQQKADAALSVKMAEGRQLVSQLSGEIKEAIENYKPPFTKLTMKLKPEKLGEIDVTMVQRGNNVHINLSSNSQALAMLQQQSGDLKMALTELGFGEASMKFTQGDQSRQQQQQHSTNERYQEMAKLDDNIEMLELIVPKYG